MRERARNSIRSTGGRSRWPQVEDLIAGVGLAWLAVIIRIGIGARGCLVEQDQIGLVGQAQARPSLNR
jgi:hypothetical protein